MTQLKNYRLFISHAWKHNESYYRLIQYLNGASYFSWQNYSVPEHAPLGTSTDYQLEEALKRQIRPTHIVLILAGMYVNHRKWIQKEIDIARQLNKPMIGIRPWASQRTPVQVELAVKELVSWNTSSIVTAIRRYAI